MTTDYRALNREQNAAQKRTADLREAIVAWRYTRLGFKIASLGDDETRKRFGIPPSQEAADVVVVKGPGKCIIAEVKGTDIHKAVRQLRSTARFVKREFPIVEAKIFVSAARLGGGLQSLGGGFQASGPHREESLLLDSNGQTLTLDAGEPITVVFSV